MIVRRPSGFIEPCQPSKVARPPSGPLWVHEKKHDGYRLVVRRDGPRIRCFTRNGHDWADRFPAIVDAALRIKAQSFLIDGEAVIARDDGMSDFRALRSKRRGHEAVCRSGWTSAARRERGSRRRTRRARRCGGRARRSGATPSERSLVPQHNRLGEAYYSPGSRPSRRAKAACSPSP